MALIRKEERMRKAFLIVAMALTMGACSAGEPNDEGSKPTAPTAEAASSEDPAFQVSLVGSVKLTNGNVIEIYEGEPGDVLLSETGRTGTEPTDMSKLTGASVKASLETLALTTTVPPEITELDKRRLEYMKTAGARTRAARPSERALNAATPPEESDMASKLTEQEFQDRACKWKVSDGAHCTGKGRNCWPNSTADYTYVKNDVNEGYAALNAVIGSVTFRFRYRPGSTWYEHGRVDVHPGQFRSFYRISTCDTSSVSCACADWDMEVKVWNAAADTYHLSTQWVERDDGFWD
jgi:hypothetical protein